MSHILFFYKFNISIFRYQIFIFKFFNPYVFDIRYDNKTSNQEIQLESLSKSKFAGWFDLYSKSFYEELCTVQDDWNGYGPWDHYSILIDDLAKA